MDYAANGRIIGKRMAQITDGTSKTVLMGERFLWTEFYRSNWAHLSHPSDGKEHRYP